MLENAKIREWMTSPVMTITQETSLNSAQQIMIEHGIRHLPVVEDGKLVGMVSSGDIRHASPSDAVSLSVWEINYLWDKITVEQAMTKPVIYLKADDNILDAIRVMYEHKIGALPVVEPDHTVVGILSEVDIFRLLLMSVEAKTR
jgi:acetoin utilization protein AcuB